MKASSPLCFVFIFLLLKAEAFSQKPKTIRQLDSLKKALTMVLPDSGLAKTLVETGEAFYDVSPDSSMSYWTKSEAFCLAVLKKNLNEKETYFFKSYLARTYNNIAYFYQRNTLKTAEAFTYYRKALDLEERIQNFKEEGKTLNNLATLYFNIGDEDNCILYHHRSLKAREKAGNTQGIIISLNNITAVYFQQGELTRAMEYSKKAEALAQVHLKEKLSLIYSNRAKIYLLQHDTVSSEAYYRKALVHALRTGNQVDICDAHLKIATLYLAKSCPDSAIAVLNKAMPIAERLKIIYEIADIHKSLGRAYLQKKDLAEGKKHISMALDLAQKINRRSDIGDCAEILSEIYEKEHDPAKAFEMYKLHISVRDSFSNETTRRNTIREQLQYDYEKKTTADSLRAEADKRITAVKFEEEKTLRYVLFGGIMVLLILGGMIFNRFRESQKQKKIIEEKNVETEAQKKIIEEKQEEILSSFNYAKRIQYSLLANDAALNEFFRDHFVLFRPRDIVSGDFYWAARANGHFYFAVCDSTGHGVPGAFMSLLSIGFLSEAVKERDIVEPNLIFDYVRSRLEESVSKDESRDGFDGVLLAVNERTKAITYAAANNNPVILKNGQAVNLPCDKMPVGKHEKHTPFSLFKIDARDVAKIYLYTDGYADQFGGPKGKKFKYKNLENLIVENCGRPMEEQRAVLSRAFEEWKGETEQTDDVCVVGLGL